MRYNEHNEHHRKAGPMSDISLLPQLYTEADYWEISQRPENALQRLELIHGQLIPKGGEDEDMAGSSRLNTVIASRINRRLGNWIEDKNLGYVTGADGVYHLGPGIVKIPDVAFIRQERAGSLEGHMFEAAPDLAVEVVSESESPESVQEKAWLYLRAGAWAVWAVYPTGGYVEVYSLDEDAQISASTYTSEMNLNGGDWLPGFELPVSDIFPTG